MRPFLYQWKFCWSIAEENTSIGSDIIPMCVQSLLSLCADVCITSDVSLGCHIMPPPKDVVADTRKRMQCVRRQRQCLFTVNQIEAFTLQTRLVDLVLNEVEPTLGDGLVKLDYDPGISAFAFIWISTNLDSNPN